MSINYVTVYNRIQGCKILLCLPKPLICSSFRTTQRVLEYAQYLQFHHLIIQKHKWSYKKEQCKTIKMMLSRYYHLRHYILHMGTQDHDFKYQSQKCYTGHSEKSVIAPTGIKDGDRSEPER